MGRGLRLTVALLVAFALALPAFAEEFSSCWVAKEFDPFYSEYQTITRCRIAGGETIDYGSDAEVPATLSPNLGTDTNGQCWYLTSAATPYEFLTRYGDGSADIIFDPDPSDPGDEVMISAALRRCTSEPTPDIPPETAAYEYVMDYIHDPPSPDLNPAPGEGVTGLDTFVGVPVPDHHQTTFHTRAGSIGVDIAVDAVIVEWGDGETTTYPPDEAILAGYPDGTASHVYEVKDPDGVSVVVEYDWTARWRVNSGSWTALSVPNTTTTVVYPVAEVVTRLTD